MNGDIAFDTAKQAIHHPRALKFDFALACKRQQSFPFELCQELDITQSCRSPGFIYIVTTKIYRAV